jgi:hypothetical protein
MQSGLRSAGLAIAAAALFATDGAFAQEAPARVTPELKSALPENESEAAVVAFTRQKAASGELLLAAASLEGALLTNPNAHGVRAVYASILCRLDDRQGAEVQLDLLKGHSIRPEYWRDVTTACGEIPEPRAAAGSGLGWWGEVAAGLQWDSDATNALITAEAFYIPDFPPRKSGLSAVAAAQFGIRARAPWDDGFFYAGAAVHNLTWIDGPENKYLAGEVRAGLGGRFGQFEWAAGGYARHLRIFDDPYLTEFGGQAELGWSVSPNSRVVVRAEAGRQNFRNTSYYVGPGIGIFVMQDGWKETIYFEYQHRIREQDQLILGMGVDNKSAQEEFNSYYGARLFGSYRTMLSSSGFYGTLSASYRHLIYRGLDDRIDDRAYGRAALGIPLAKSGLNLEAGLSYTIRNSSGPPEDYHSVGGDLRLIWRFGKGG